MGRGLRGWARACQGRWAPGHFLARTDLDPHEVGRAGERFALRYLRRMGYRTLAQRLVTRGAELDLVLARGDELVVVEVKTTLDDPRFLGRGRFPHRIQVRQARSARRLAREFGFPKYRLLLAEVTRRRGHPPSITLWEVHGKSPKTPRSPLQTP